MSEVSYLGHVFSANGMYPDQRKIQTIKDWPIPQDVHAVRQDWLHTTSDNLAAPLHRLTQKGVVE